MKIIHIHQEPVLSSGSSAAEAMEFFASLPKAPETVEGLGTLFRQIPWDTTESLYTLMHRAVESIRSTYGAHFLMAFEPDEVVRLKASCGLIRGNAHEVGLLLHDAVQKFNAESHCIPVCCLPLTAIHLAASRAGSAMHKIPMIYAVTMISLLGEKGVVFMTDENRQNFTPIYPPDSPGMITLGGKPIRMDDALGLGGRSNGHPLSEEVLRPSDMEQVAQNARDIAEACQGAVEIEIAESGLFPTGPIDIRPLHERLASPSSLPPPPPVLACVGPA